MKTLILAAALPLLLPAAPRLLDPLVGEVAATPAPAPEPAPKYIPKLSDILSSKTTVVNGQSITILEIKPIDLPEPPPPESITLRYWRTEKPATTGGAAEGNPFSFSSPGFVSSPLTPMPSWTRTETPYQTFGNAK